MGPVAERAVFRGELTATLEHRTALPDGELPRVLPTLLRGTNESLPVAPAEERAVWSLDGGSAHTRTVREILRRAEHDRETPWPIPLASSAARVHRDGNRELWEASAFARQRRLSRAAVAAAVTLDEAWIDDVADGVTLLCEQSSWCWPAHDDTMRVHGSVLATVTDPFVDLGAGEIAGQLAWIDHLLGAQLDERYPGLRERIRHETRTRVLDPFVRRRDWHWLGLDGDVHNWNPWIHGNVLVAALQLMDSHTQSDERAEVIAFVIEGLDRYVSALPSDGAIDEGYSYWWNGACRALEALDILAFATNGALDVTDSITALRETIAFPHRMHLGGDWYLNLADGQAKPSRHQPWHSLHRAARRVNDAEALAHAVAYRVAGAPVADEAEGLGRLLRGLTDPEWIGAAQGNSPLPREVWLGSTQVMVARETSGSVQGLTVAVKGGHNGENHNHNDVGSFLVASNGVPVIVDAGRPTYTLATFGENRYDIWTMQSSWHNVPEIRGTAQSVGVHAAASAVDVQMTDSSSELSLDLAAAYSVPGLRSWKRHVKLDRELSRVVIDDAWNLEPFPVGTGGEPLSEPPTSVRLLLAGDILLEANSVLVSPLEGTPPIRIRWPLGIAATLTARPLDDPMLSDVWGESLTRLDLDVTDRDSISVTVEMNEPKVRDPR